MRALRCVTALYPQAASRSSKKTVGNLNQEKKKSGQDDDKLQFSFSKFDPN
jgi:hypothetical protein